MNKNGRVIGPITLAMINIATISSVKNWPLMAEYGTASIFFMLLAALIFFLPVSLVSAELATAWPKAGGVFAWVKEAFGHRLGFLSIWLVWLQDVFWYPTILTFIAAGIAYLIDPELTKSPLYMGGSILILFWVITLINFKGMRTSSWVSSLGAIIGTFIPGGLIILLGITWYTSGHPMQISFTPTALLPTSWQPSHLIFFTGIILSFAGMELSAVHAKDVRHPQKDYPKAILISFLTILFITLFGVMAIALVVPGNEINLAAGSLQAFSYFLNQYDMQWAMPIIAIFLSLGALASMSTWIIGPSKGLLAAAEVGDLPHVFRKVNQHHVPVALLTAQGIIVSLLAICFFFLPSINATFLFLTNAISIFYLLTYMLMFAAAIRLRYTRAHTQRTFAIPGKSWGMWTVSLIGILACLFAIAIGFLPPEDIPDSEHLTYSLSLLGGTILGALIPSIILLFHKPDWDHP